MSQPNASSGQPRDFRGRVVLITGAGSGVGLECARVFAAQGAKLLLAGRSADKLEAAVAELAEIRTQTAICAGDVTDSAFATTAHEVNWEAVVSRVRARESAREIVYIRWLRFLLRAQRYFEARARSWLFIGQGPRRQVFDEDEI